MKVEQIRIRLDIGMNVTIGAPLKLNEIIIGEITSAEVEGDYVLAVMELNEKGKEIYKTISEEQNVGTYSAEFKGKISEK